MDDEFVSLCFTRLFLDLLNFLSIKYRKINAGEKQNLLSYSKQHDFVLNRWLNDKKCFYRVLQKKWNNKQLLRQLLVKNLNSFVFNSTKTNPSLQGMESRDFSPPDGFTFEIKISWIPRKWLLRIPACWVVLWLNHLFLRPILTQWEATVTFLLHMNPSSLSPLPQTKPQTVQFTPSSDSNLIRDL